ncbi:MAG: hypothetical protein AAF465_08915 [Pseudomonadota bacterium]
MIALLAILAFGFPLVAYIWSLRQKALADRRKLQVIQRQLKVLDEKNNDGS